MAHEKMLTDLQIAHICRGLSLQLHAGISLADGLYLLAEDAQGTLAPMLHQMGAGLDRGAELQEIMEQAGCFPDHVRGMVRIGQRSGKLEQTFRSLAAYYEQRGRQKRQIRQALSYPAMVFALMLVVVAVLLVKVLPVFDGVYASLGSRLTGIAAGLLSLGRLLERAMPGLLGILVLVGTFAIVYWKIKSVRLWVNDRYQRRFGDRGIGRKYNNARFAEALAMGLSSGLTLEESVELAGDLLHSVPDAAERCRLCSRRLAEGAALPEAMKEAQLLPTAESRMLAVGLRAGNADRVMEEIARRLHEQAEDALEDTVSKIEPALVLIASLLVGVILLAVMLPLMNIMSTIG